MEEEASCQVDRSFGDSVHIGGHAEDAVRLDTQGMELRHVDHTELGSRVSGGSASPGMTGTSSLGEPGRVKLQLAVGRSVNTGRRVCVEEEGKEQSVSDHSPLEHAWRTSDR